MGSPATPLSTSRLPDSGRGVITSCRSAVVTVDEHGKVIDRWSTLVRLRGTGGRRVGPRHIHGISRRQLRRGAATARRPRRARRPARRQLCSRRTMRSSMPSSSSVPRGVPAFRSSSSGGSAPSTSPAVSTPSGSSPTAWPSCAPVTESRWTDHHDALADATRDGGGSPPPARAPIGRPAATVGRDHRVALRATARRRGTRDRARSRGSTTSAAAAAHGATDAPTNAH